MEPLSSHSFPEHQRLTDLLTDLVVSKSFSKGERLYVFANKDGAIALSPSKEAAKKMGYTQKLPLEEVMKKSHEIMKGCQNETIRFQVATQLRFLALRKVVKYGEKIPAGKKEIVNKVIQMAVELSPLVADSISPARLQTLHTCLQNASVISRSREGRDGVYYLQNDSGEVNTAVKLVRNPFKCIVADRFFRFLGYQTPSYEALSRSHPSSDSLPRSGEQIIGEIGSKAQEYMNHAASHNPVEEDLWHDHAVTCRSQMKQARSILLMNYLNLRSFSSLQFNEKVELLKEPRFLHALGMMHLFDVCLRNRDRLTIGNLQNFLVLNPANVKSLKDNPQNLLKIVSLIDHDVNLSEFGKYVGEAKQELQALVKDPHHLGSVVNLLFDQINLIHKDKVNVREHVDAKQMEQEIHKGLLTGVQMLAANFPDEQSLSGIFDIPEGSKEAVRLKDLWEVIAFVKSLKV